MTGPRIIAKPPLKVVPKDGWLQAEEDPALRKASGSVSIETNVSPWLVAGLLGTGFVLGFVAAVLALGVPR